jgi:hypothetical protein
MDLGSAAPSEVTVLACLTTLLTRIIAALPEMETLMRKTSYFAPPCAEALRASA